MVERRAQRLVQRRVEDAHRLRSTAFHDDPDFIAGELALSFDGFPVERQALAFVAAADARGLPLEILPAANGG